MNTYILVYLMLHGVAVTLLALNIIVQYNRTKTIKSESIIRDSNWLRNFARSRTFLYRSVINFVWSFIAEAVSMWLLWMGGMFD